MIPAEVARWFADQGYGRVARVHNASGGCIHDSNRIRTTGGASFFLKTNSRIPPDMFRCEADGLAALRQPDSPRIPRVFLVGAEFLLLEDLRPATPLADYWEDFGRKLARLHLHTSPQFGFTSDNYIGSTPQPNPWTDDGYEFFASQRLMFMARLVYRRGLLTDIEYQKVVRITARLRELIPPQPASLIHGDLWSGNALSDADGKPALIDPAAHFGWAEAELAMTRLFGGFPAQFYHAYQELRRLPPGLDERLPLYNLYHLLNHVNLFGAAYLPQTTAILSRYA